MLVKYPILVFAPVVGAVANVLSHLAISRLKNGRGQMVCLFLSFISGMIVMLPFAALAYPKENNILNFFSFLLVDIITYAAFGYGYFHFININIASLRIRILHEIAISANGLSKEEIISRYNAEQIVANRLNRLIGNNQVIEKNGRYFLGENRIFITLFWIFELLKYTVRGKGNRFLEAIKGESLSIRLLISSFWENQFLRFLCIGAINTLFGYFAYAFLVILRIDYRIALTISTIAAVLFNFHTNGRFVFRNTGRTVLLKFIFLNVIMYIVNQGLLISCVSLGIGELISQAFIVPVIVISSFIANKLWVFKAREVLS